MIKLGKVLKIKAFKFPDIPHYEWEGVILHQTSDYLLHICKPGRKLIHHSKNKVFTFNNTSIEFFSLKEWYTAAMEIEKEEVVSVYCNIAKPYVFNNQEICFIDLDYVKEKTKNGKELMRRNVYRRAYSWSYKCTRKVKRRSKKRKFPFQ
ncbi:hypothetical protein [Metabacillus niabensis]|uniref:hypothetical protein n=1 Tax=Metabacillus niabensis TaxID=324854 RepID=UPI001CFC1987|nr:hypothetical protein [Metabacillus niabensis]